MLSAGPTEVRRFLKCGDIIGEDNFLFGYRSKSMTHRSNHHYVALMGYIKKIHADNMNIMEQMVLNSDYSFVMFREYVLFTAFLFFLYKYKHFCTVCVKEAIWIDKATRSHSLSMNIGYFWHINNVTAEKSLTVCN